MGTLAFGKRDELVFLGREIGEQRKHSDQVARKIDAEQSAIIAKAYARAMDVLTTHKDRLIQLAERLVAEETVEQDAFELMFADLPDPRKDAGNSPTIAPLPQPERRPVDAPQTAPKQAPSPQPA